MAKTIDILAKDDNGDEAQTVANIPTKRELFEKNNVSKALLEDDDALENLELQHLLETHGINRMMDSLQTWKTAPLI